MLMLHSPSNPTGAVPDLYDRTIAFNCVSKSYAMTGWRIGYCGGPAPIVDAVSVIQSQSTSSPSSIAQKAAAGALPAHGQGAARILTAIS